ncbi:MAG: L-lactate dehydrogenase [Candidatus Omnitrophica bacterium]|nr:L-lactate dehydrogenase [Candidatus Omnitrophota bacterium]
MKALRPKIAIVGCGNVGSAFAFALSINGIAREIALIDNNNDLSRGESMDLNHGASFIKPVLIYHSGYEACRGADIVVITAGARQKPNQTRIDLVQANARIFAEIIPQVIKYAQDALLLIVTNPVDILTYITYKISGFDPSRVIGSGTVLDSSRLRFLIGRHCNIDARNVHAYIVGEHGDTELPLWSHANIAGMVLKEYCPLCKAKCDYGKELDGIFNQVKNAAYEIINAKGATCYAVALALVRIVEAMIRDENSVLPVSALIDDYYGIKDICLSLPCVVNKSGIKKILRLELSDIEQKKLKESSDALKAVLRAVKY